MNEKEIRKEERDNFTIVLEELRSDFRMFGEDLSMVREKGDATFEEVGKIKIEISEIKGEIGEIKGEIGEMKGEIGEIKIRLDSIESEIKSIRKEFDMFRDEIKEKAGVDYVREIEKRIKRIEDHLKLSTA